MSQKIQGSGEERVTRQVASAFNDAQRTTAAHPRASKLLLSAFEQNATAFFSSFIQALNRIVIIFSRDPPVERLIQFVAGFSATHTESMPNFCISILTYLLSQSNARTPAVRFRTVQLIASILKLLPESAEIPDDVLKSLQIAVFNRVFDRVPRVRAAAAGALCRMQTTGDAKSDECTTMLTKMLSCDSSYAVRKAAIQAIAITDTTVPFLLRRIRDVHPEVRRIAYETIAFKLCPHDLHRDELTMVLREGLHDRTKSVRDTCRQKVLLEAWMKTACNGNVFDLVDILGCHGNEDEVLQVLKIVFESSQYSELVQSTEIDVNNLTHDDVLVLRGLGEANRGDGGIDKFIPTTLAYSEVLNYYAVNEFASKHLLELCKCIDMSDEAGRKALERVIRSVFLTKKNISESVTESAVRAMRRTMVDEEACARLLLEILRQDILEVGGDDYAQAGEGNDLSKEGWRVTRALNICLEALRIAPASSTISSSTNTLYLSMTQICAVPHLMSEDENVRAKAMECLGLFCLLDKSGTEAKMQTPVLLQACQADVFPIQKLALKILIDMLMLFDFSEEVFTDCPKSRASLSKTSGTSQKRRQSQANCPAEISEKCLSILSKYLTHTDGEMRTIAVQGLARLLYVRRFAPNATLVSRLMIVFHNPETENDTELRQYLSMFFPIFAAGSTSNLYAIEKAFEPTCTVLINAPEHNPLSKVSVVHVAQFIIMLSAPELARTEAVSNQEINIGWPPDQIHERLAELVLNHIIGACQEDEIEQARLYCKILASFRLTLSTDNDDSLQCLGKLSKFGIAEADDQRVKTELRKFSHRLEAELAKLEQPEKNLSPKRST